MLQFLTLQEGRRKSNGKVATISTGLYARWRARNWEAHTFAERPDGSPLTEQVLQLIWQHQRLRRDDLRTATGEPIRVFHPGFRNYEPGPDFRGAVLQFGDTLACHGDVEVDLSPRGWHSHRHDQNPAYQRVILHVVWEAQAGGDLPLPTLPLHSYLDAPLEELALCLRREPRLPPGQLLGRCAPPLGLLPAEDLESLLKQAAQSRFESKAGQLQARGRQVGWQRALWEGLFGALGYKNNVWPMRRISELLPALTGDETQPLTTVGLQARLLGVSGLLPSDLERASASSLAYLQQIWHEWWREREQFADVALPRSSWRLGGLRPANNPQRRLALAAHWLTESNLPERLEKWFAGARPDDSGLPHSLWQILQAKEDEFWSRHWTFRSRALPDPQPLIGAQRVTDLAINVILPWFWIRAGVGQNQLLQERALACYLGWPAAEDNAVLRLARRRLFDTRPVALTTAALQQGLLQIVRDFCDYSNALCAQCQFPALVQAAVA